MDKNGFRWLIVGLLLSACNVFEVFTYLPLQQDSKPTITTYRNERFNFELDYPTDWFVEEHDDMAMFTSFQLGTLSGVEGVPSEHTKIDFHFPDTNQGLTFENFISQSVSNEYCIPNDPYIFMLDNGGQAVEIIASSDMGGTHAIINLDLEGRYFRFVAFGNLASIRDIARSLRSISPSEINDYEYDFDKSAVILPENHCD